MPPTVSDKRREKLDGRSYYDSDAMVQQLARLKTTPRQISIKAGVSTIAVGEAFSGECKKFETLWLIAVKGMGMKWASLFKNIQ